MHKDCNAAVQGNHDILVATEGAGGKAASIICEEVGQRYVQEGKLRKVGGQGNGLMCGNICTTPVR